MSYVSESLKELARELHVPVLALSQLNRDCERRGENKQPQLSDLRDTGSLEQDADRVLMLYRASEYFDDADPKEADLFIRKNRHGPTGKVDLLFDKELMTFASAPAKASKELKRLALPNL